MNNGFDRQSFVMQIEALKPGQQITIEADDDVVNVSLDANDRLFFEFPKGELQEFHNTWADRGLNGFNDNGPSVFEQLYQQSEQL